MSGLGLGLKGFLNIFFNDMAKDSEDSQHNRSQELEDQKFEEMGDNQ